MSILVCTPITEDGLTSKNTLRSPLKLVTVPLAGKKEKTLFAPFEPLYKFHGCPAKVTLAATGTGCPEELYFAEMGPALKFASQIMISLTFDPPAEFDVNKSYATSATTVPDVVCFQFQTD